MPSISKRNDNLPVGNEPHLNSPKLTLAFKRSRFFENSLVSEYDTHASTFKSASEYQGDPIVPPAHKGITVETDLQHTYFLYEDMLDIRLFLQCNGDLDDLHESLLPFSTTN